MNYKWSQNEEAGTYTIHDVEIVGLGTWRGRGTPAEGLKIGEQQFEEILHADKEAREFTRPVVKDDHDNPVTGKAGGLVGLLGPIKRVGKKLVADIGGLTEVAFTAMRQGRAGRISPEILRGWVEPSTGTKYPMLVKAIAFIGGKMPAITTLQPLATFDAGNCETMILLENIGDGDGSSSAGGGAQMATEAELKAQEVTLQEGKTDLKDRTAALEERAKVAKERKLHDAWRRFSGAAGVKAIAEPSEKESFLEMGMAMDDEALIDFTGGDNTTQKGTRVDQYVDRFPVGRKEVESKESESKMEGEGNEDEQKKKDQPPAEALEEAVLAEMTTAHQAGQEIDMREAERRVSEKDPKLVEAYTADTFRKHKED